LLTGRGMRKGAGAGGDLHQVRRAGDHRGAGGSHSAASTRALVSGPRTATADDCRLVIEVSIGPFLVNARFSRRPRDNSRIPAVHIDGKKAS